MIRKVRAMLAVILAVCVLLGSALAETYPLLVQGNKGTAVLRLQQTLARLGYDPGKQDGKYGAYTENAVRHFQRDYGLKVDGKAGSETQRLLYQVAQGSVSPTKVPAAAEPANQVPTRTLRQGSTGTDVRTVQLRLMALGYYQQTPNAMYDQATVTAVSMFQFYNGLTADGVAGGQTYARLFSGTAKAAPSQMTTPAPTAAPTAATPGSYVYTVPTRTLRKGSQGNDVMTLQLRLRELGYDCSSGGTYDTNTATAVRLFQSRNGLSVDGVAGTKTVSRLFSDDAVDAPAAPVTPAPTQAPTYTMPTRTLRRGASGADVTSVQQRLLVLNYNVVVTGVYDDTTVQAVRLFQQYNRLSADGVAGSQTYAKLFSAGAVAAPMLQTAEPTAAPVEAPTAVPTQALTQSTGWQMPTRTMYKGSTGSDVSWVQQRLLELGYCTFAPNGQYDDRTAAAVKQFQQVNGLNADGMAGPKTYAVLFSTGAKPAGTMSVTTQEPVIAPTVTDAPATSYTMLKSGSRGDAVTRLQQRLQALGYTVNVNGSYDTVTIAAVRAFQTNNYLSVDGIAGSETQTTLYSDAARAASQTPTQDYTTLSVNTGKGSSKVRTMQQRLQELGYPVNVDGDYDGKTHNAVVAFQQRNGLVISGIANGTTLSVLYSGSAKPYSTAVSSLPADQGRMNAPTNVQLLWWYDDVKKVSSSGQTVLVYDPATGISWNIKFYSMGKHADSQPATWQDTQLMNRSFGSTSWDCHPVFVRLNDGRWTLAAMHNYPHLYGSVNDNGFGGHLCIHFLRTYEECRAAGDTNYGVQMQDAIRNYWRKMTGETIP